MDLGKCAWIGRLGVVMLVIAIAGCTDPGDSGINNGSSDAADAAESDGHADAGEDSDSLEELPAAEFDQVRGELVLQIWCARLHQCPEQISSYLRRVGSGAVPQERCPELLGSNFLFPSDAASFEAGRLDYDEQSARDCLGTMRAALENDVCMDEPNFESCGDVYSPAVGSGEACARTAECEGENYCNTGVDEDACVGESVSPRSEGDTCDTTIGGQCGELTCSSQRLTEGTCVQTASKGVQESCGSPAECEDGLTCDRSDGVCLEQRFAEQGDSCEGGEVICPMGTRCVLDGADPPERRCLAVVELGESCSGDSTCQADAVCNDNVCEHLAAEGESCNGSDTRCQPLLDCVEGECVDAFPSCYE